MADSTVSTMAAASALDGTELYYGVQGGADKKVTGAQIKTLVSASPTLVTPNLGTPSAGVLTNATGLPLTTGVTGTLPVANGGTGTASPGLVAGTNVTVTGSWPNQTVNASGGGSFTGGAISSPIQITGGTQATSNPVIDSTQTWNAAGVTFTGWKVNITNTASAAASVIADFQVGAASQFSIRKDGALISSTGPAGGLALYGGNNANKTEFIGNAVFGYNSSNVQWAMYQGGHDGLVVGSTGQFFWGNGQFSYGTVDLGLGRNAAGVAEVNNGTPGTYRDLKLRSVIQNPPVTITPANNGELVVEATSNTTLTFKLKGSDGTVRSATLTLA